MAMAEETKDAYKREKASLIGFQGSFTKKETMWREAVELWHKDPLSNASREMPEEFRLAVREAKARLDTALYSVISYGVVTESYENFMDQVEDRYQIINKVFMALSASLRDHLKKEEDQKLQLVRDEMAEVKQEQDERKQELEARDALEENRVDRKTKLMDLELLVVREKAALEAAARANPAQAQPPPVPLVPAPHAGGAGAAGALQRRYREVSSLHPGVLCIQQSPEELRIFQNYFWNWYQISCLDTLDVEQQIFTLKKCCDLPIQQKINWEQPSIDAALQALTQVWVTEYPIVVRHLEFLRNKQTQNENDEEFVLRAKQLFVNGDIERMTPLQLQKLNIISGLRDSKLQIKLLELPNDATLADIDAA